MTIQKNRILDRLNDIADESRSRMHDMGDDCRRHGRIAVRRAQRGLREGGEALAGAEETVVRTVKAHPLAFALVGAAVASLVAAVLLFGSRHHED
jgi:hypothetical protein